MIRPLSLSLCLYLPLALLAAEQTAEQVQCLELAAMVAASCPTACQRRHCMERCIPPYTEDGRCGLCQQRCDFICDSQSEARKKRCLEGEAAAPEPVDHTDSGR